MRNLHIPLKAHPHCKINLGLHVLGKREDGYHDIDTIFVPVRSITDSLEITESDTPQMIQEGIELDSAAEDNLCMKAWRLLHDEYGVPPVTIRLNKGIPYGAGLGGGSSDAAFTLQLLNRRYLRLSRFVLQKLAARLGADCPFFLQQNIVRATGRGDKLESLNPRVNLNGYRVVIEMPEGEHVSTKEAYECLDHIPYNVSRRKLPYIVQQPVEEWRYLLVNDFEAAVFPSHPAIAELKYDMYRRGAVYASMTGSGAAVYGIFPEK